MARTSFGVALEAKHDLGCTVPPCRNIFRHVSRILLGIDGETSREAKVGNLEFAIGIYQQVSGLQVTVEHVGRVNVLETAEDLVDEGLEVGIGQGLAGSDNGGEIALHQLCAASAQVAPSPSPHI